MAVADRFSAASGRPPLSALSQTSRAELETLLGRVERFEDLPGKWQAALLESEAGGVAAPSSCCCKGHATA